MNENVIEFLRNAEVATVTFCQGRYISRIKELAKEKPDECQIIVENKDGSIMAHIPTEWIKINPKKELSEETKAMLADRLRSLNVKGRNESKNDSGSEEDS